jgi:hypothetical protein
MVDTELQIDPGAGNIASSMRDFHVHGILSVGGDKPGNDVGKMLAQCAADNELLLERVVELEKAATAAKENAAKVLELDFLIKELLKTTTTTATATTTTTATTATTTTATSTTTSTTATATTTTQGTSQQAYTSAGTYSWVAPAGVTSVSMVGVGAGGGAVTFPNGIPGGSGGGGGGLGYKHNVPVTPGATYTVVVGLGGRGAYGGDGNQNSANYIDYIVAGGSFTAEAGAATSFNGNNLATGGVGAFNTAGGAGGIRVNGNTDGGANGGLGGSNGGTRSYWGFGGGAAGYGPSGTGGQGGVWQSGGVYTVGATAGSSGTGAAGGAAGWSQQCGVGLLGKGATGGISQGGSGGTVGQIGNSGGGASTPGTNVATAMRGAPGGFRLIWPGTTRYFPDTNTGDL